MRADPKIVVIGAGSFFFGRKAIWHMVMSEVLRGGTLALVDTDPAVLANMMELARRAIDESRAPTTLIGSTNRQEVLADADFVILTFSEKNTHYRGVDCEVARKYGIRMCSGDTIGPGGIFRSLREVPRALEMVRDVEKLAPEAWLINLVNPTAVLGIALMRYAPRVRSFALCDGLHEPRYRLSYLKALGIVDETCSRIPPAVERRLVFHTMGVNHFTWVTQFAYQGQNMLPRWRRLLDEQITNDATRNDNNAKSKHRNNPAYAAKLMDLFGTYPDRIAHAKEYVTFFQGTGVLPVAPEPIMVFDAPDRQVMMEDRYRETVRYATGEKPMAEFFQQEYADHATDIIESMWGGLGKYFYINCPNRGAVTNMADDAFLEARCALDMNGPTPVRMGPMPRGLLALQQQILDTHELTAEAAVACDRDMLLRALCTDPLVNNIEDAQSLMADLLAAQAAHLPPQWGAKGAGRRHPEN